MFEYTVCKENSPSEFNNTCLTIEKEFPQLIKEKILIDVDGSTIQIYHKDGSKILVYDDYDVGAVYIESEIELNHLFLKP